MRRLLDRLGPWERGLVAFTLVAHALGGFLPLFGGPGYESSLALGLTLPLPIACASALLAARPERDGPAGPAGALVAALELALVVLAAHALLLLAHGLRVGFCDASAGLALFALGPGVGSLLAATWGAACGLGGRWFPRRGRALAVTLAALGPVLGVLISLVRFYSSPMIFAFDPFVGFFAGTLYDTVIDGLPRLVSYRAGSGGTLLVATALAVALRAGEVGGGPRVSRAALLRPLPAALSIVGFALSLGVTLAGPELGHYQTQATIREALGHSLDSQRCEIVYASGIERDRARLLGEECDAHVASHEAFFDTRVSQRITVFTFASASQKGALMGASRTYIAKPWRYEVYVQSREYPHPVLGHELAHVVAGRFGRGPLRVAGPLFGLIPDPGRIEGFAVAAAPREDTDHTLVEWTRALRALSLLPELGDVFRLSFLGENSSTAYTVAGSFVSFLRQRHGPRALRAWYAGASLSEATGGQDLAALEQAFLEFLDAEPVSEEVLARARARFDRPAIFGRRCPHAVDHLLGEGHAALDRSDPEQAFEHYERVLALDPTSFGARLGAARCARRSGDAPLAAERYGQLSSDDALSSVERALVAERMGDIALQRGDDELALTQYAEAEKDAFDEHRRRTIEVKRLAASSLSDSSPGRAALVELLVGDERGRTDRFLASAMIGAWSEREPEDGLPDYLIAKNLYGGDRFEVVARHLDRALSRGLALPSVRREALRLRVMVGCALGDLASARHALDRYLGSEGLSSARKAGMERFAARCGLRRAP